MTKTSFLKTLKNLQGKYDPHSPKRLEKVKIKVLFEDGYWNFNCMKCNLIEVRKTITKHLLLEDFKKIIGIEF